MIDSRLPVLILLIAILPAQCSAQASAPAIPASDPTAQQYLAQSLARMQGATVLSDITINASAQSFVAGSSEAGSATLKARTTGESRFDLGLTTLQRSEIVLASDGTPTGAWVDAQGVHHQMAPHNCWVTSAWFSPAAAITIVLNSSNTVLAYVGPETRNGGSVQHIRGYRYVSGQQSSLIKSSTVIDFYLDSGSLLPTAIAFNLHPDNDAHTNVPVEIRFASYQQSSGVLVPFRIQKLYNGLLNLDLTATSVTINSGLPTSDFAVQ